MVAAFAAGAFLIVGAAVLVVTTVKESRERAIREGRAYEPDHDGLVRMGPDAYGVVCYTLGNTGYSNISISCVQVQEALVPKK
jgi:hypothetical protein